MSELEWLFDHLIGAGKQRRWHAQTKGFCRPEVDHQFNFCRHLNRQFIWLCA